MILSVAKEYQTDPSLFSHETSVIGAVGIGKYADIVQLSIPGSLSGENKIIIKYVVLKADTIIGAGQTVLVLEDDNIVDYYNVITDFKNEAIFAIDTQTNKINCTLATPISVLKYYLITPVGVQVTYNERVGFYITSPGDIIPATNNTLWSLSIDGNVYNINDNGIVSIGSSKLDGNSKLVVNGNTSIFGVLNIINDDGRVIISSDEDFGKLFSIEYSGKNINKSIIYVDNSGNIGVNTNLPEAALHISGEMRVDDTLSVGSGNNVGARIHVTGRGHTYDTLSLWIKNDRDVDLLRVHDDGRVYIKALIIDDFSHTQLGKLTFGNGLDASNYYDGSKNVTVKLDEIIGTPTGVVYLP